MVEPVKNYEPACMEDFEILRLLGQGGFGIVQLVRCTNPELREKYSLPDLSQLYTVGVEKENHMQHNVLRIKSWCTL